MFLGEYEHSVDGKGRIVMPRAFRDELAAGVVVAKGRDENLVVYKKDAYAQVAEDMKAKVGDDKAARAFLRTFFSSADVQSVDTNTGRMLVNANLRDYAGLEPGGEVIVIGNFDTVELWNPERYAPQREIGERLYLDDGEGGGPADD